MLGYMTEKEALLAGFTHHGKYYGIPVWIAPHKDFMVATKWAPMELVMTVAHLIEGAIRGLIWKDDDPHFQFMLGREISNEHCPHLPIGWDGDVFCEMCGKHLGEEDGV